MWREKYDAALRDGAAHSGGACAAETLLASVTEKVDLSAATAKAQLSAIGKELTRPLRDVLAVNSKTPRDEKLALFKLQVACRLLLCCEDGVFGAAEQEDELASGKKKKKKTKKTKKLQPKMSVRGELRELLDRVALLIDSANPPSMADSEDEPSPFHAFLLSVLERRLGLLLPDVFTALREVYELTEDEVPVARPLPIAAPASKEESSVKDSPGVDSSSILSALKDERPSKKRSLAATSDAFKEVILPGQVQKGARTKHSSPKMDALSKPSSERTGRTSSSGSQPSSSSSKSTKRPMADSSLVSLAAASKKSKPSRPTNSLLPRAMSMPMPMLVRNMDRQMLPMRSAGSATSGAGPGNFAGANGQLRKPSSLARPSGSNASQASRASVVMRTPDRPQRVQRSQPRILVEASPPLRNPFATARLRRPGSQMPK